MTNKYQRDTRANKPIQKPQGRGYMQELDKWVDEHVIEPLFVGWKEGDSEQAIDDTRKALKNKMLESYRNGQAAGPRREGRRYAR